MIDSEHKIYTCKSLSLFLKKHFLYVLRLDLFVSPPRDIKMSKNLNIAIKSMLPATCSACSRV